MNSMDAVARPRASRPSNWKRRFVWLSAAAAVLAAAVLMRGIQGDRPAAAQSRNTSAAAANKQNAASPGHPQHDVMAIVNGQDISRDQLAKACVQRYGKDVLESLVNKRLILNHCKNHNITVTNQDIATEIDRMAARFKLGREQWLELLEKERGISPDEYARDIVWPTVALRKLTAEQLQVTPEEIQKAYESEFGDMVRVRLISVDDGNQARQLQAQAKADPKQFARLAMDHSTDVNSASIGGLIPPIRRHVNDPSIETEAFRLQPGQISSIIQVGNQFVLLKCEARVPQRTVPLPQVQERIVQQIKDQKLREAAHQKFADLQKNATVQNVLNDPRLRRTMPNVVATVNGDPITEKELQSECLLQHGEEVLELEINQLLLHQELKKTQVAVTEADIEAEMRHAAELAGVVDQAGEADLARWVDVITGEQGLDLQQYKRDAVWPSAALKKLTSSSIEVTQEDVNKGFEANFGQHVRCRAIVLDDFRRAQEVWEKARRNPSVEYFGQLAEEYSVEPTSKALQGEVPPLKRHSGQPQLEEVAFNLQPGQISGIVNVGDTFIILRSEGRTEKLDVDEDDVRDILVRDIFEKKLRRAMSQKLEQIHATARIDNYLARSSKAPLAATGAAASRQDGAVRQTSGVQQR